MTRLKIHSIFKSISGETSLAFPQGSVCTFIRFQACNLFPKNCCSYCDTKYAQNKSGGKLMTLHQILNTVKKLKSKNIVITGGEPLFQWAGLIDLIQILEYHINVDKISIETNGSIPITKSDFLLLPIHWVVDWKLKSSSVPLTTKEKVGIVDSFPTKNSIIKFVILGPDDFKEALVAIKLIRQKEFGEGFKFAFSPCSPLNPAKLYEWMLEEPLCSEAILNVQLHKRLKLDEPK
jgi:organic radical activating enzyme